MSEQVIGRFVKVLRGAEVSVSPAETLDAVQVTALLGYQDREALKQGLSLVLKKANMTSWLSTNVLTISFVSTACRQ